jgi:hypothetical protein
MLFCLGDALLRKVLEDVTTARVRAPLKARQHLDNGQGFAQRQAWECTEDVSGNSMFWKSKRYLFF